MKLIFVSCHIALITQQNVQLNFFSVNTFQQIIKNLYNEVQDRNFYNNRIYFLPFDVNSLSLFFSLSSRRVRITCLPLMDEIKLQVIYKKVRVMSGVIEENRNTPSVLAFVSVKILN